MPDTLYDANYNPDVLSCLANLSNDEVFTPPNIANAMLDMLPQDLFENPDTKFLDPACKSGVFLREIAKRLIVGLEGQIPDLQERLDHIFHHQLYGIAITELTSLLARRSVYCAKYPNSKYSVSEFDNAEGNIRYRKMQHTWITEGKRTFCKFCGVSKDTELGTNERGITLESYAYETIHTLNPEDLFKMKFDVIISNPPYHFSTAGDDNGPQAKPLYHLFVEQAKKLKPTYLSMIIPARWYAGGWGLDEFRDAMISDNHLSEIHDFQDAADCFPGVEIKGGVCYFLWTSHTHKICSFFSHRGPDVVSRSERPLKEDNCDILIRYNSAIPIFRKVMSHKESTFDSLVSTKKPFGFTTNFHGHTQIKTGFVKLYANRRVEWVAPSDVSRNSNAVNKHKILVPKAVGSGDPATDVIKPIYCEPNACCTETYLLIGPFKSKLECDNVISYISTRFFHFLVTLQKNTQDCMKKVYSFVPIQDFSERWTDEKLYKKYGITSSEQRYIESLVWPQNTMDGGSNDAK